MNFDLYKESLGKDKNGKEVYMKDIWPTNEIEETLKISFSADMFIKRYSNVSEGPKQWQQIKTKRVASTIGKKILHMLETSHF